MKKQILSEELKRMNKLAGLMNENDSVDEARYGRGSVDPWADIETGGEYSKSKKRVSASYKRQKEEDSLGSTSYQSFTNKIKRLGNLMTDEEAVEMMDDMKRMLSQDEIMDVYNFVDRNNISSPIYTYLDQYKGETGSYGLEEGEDVPPYEEPEDPMDHQVAEVMIKEGQLGRAITKMLIEEMLKEEEVDDKTLLDNIDDLRDYDIHPITSILPSKYSDGDPEKVLIGLLNIIKKVNPNANIENKKISLQRAFDETMQELSKASWAEHTVTMGVKEYFRNNLQMFR